MYVCLCHAVTDTQIKAAICEGKNDIESLKNHLQLGRSCGRCTEMIDALIVQASSDDTPHPSPSIYIAQPAA